MFSLWEHSLALCAVPMSENKCFSIFSPMFYWSGAGDKFPYHFPSRLELDSGLSWSSLARSALLWGWIHTREPKSIYFPIFALITRKSQVLGMPKIKSQSHSLLLSHHLCSMTFLRLQGVMEADMSGMTTGRLYYRVKRQEASYQGMGSWNTATAKDLPLKASFLPDVCTFSLLTPMFSYCLNKLSSIICF